MICRAAERVGKVAKRLAFIRSCCFSENDGEFAQLIFISNCAIAVELNGNQLRIKFENYIFCKTRYVISFIKIGQGQCERVKMALTSWFGKTTGFIKK